jgi:hypothetical protein
MAIDFARDYQKALGSYNKQANAYTENYNSLANIYNSQREDYLGKYEDYLDVVDIYNSKVQQYYDAVDAYNAQSQREYDQYKNTINAYNASLIQDQNAYWGDGTYVGGGPYTYYNGQQIGRTGAIEQRKLTPDEYKDYGFVPATQVYGEWGDPILDENGNPVTQGGESRAGQDWFVNTAGTLYRFAPRPASSFSPSIAQPTFTEKTPQFTAIAPEWSEPEAFDLKAPIAPKNLPAAGSTLGNIAQQDLYQQLFGRGTLDTLSNEAWSLANIASPFTTSEESAYDTGNMTNLNNPFGYVNPDALTTGEGAKDYGMIQSPFL